MQKVPLMNIEGYKAYVVQSSKDFESMLNETDLPDKSDDDADNLVQVDPIYESICSKDSGMSDIQILTGIDNRDIHGLYEIVGPSLVSVTRGRKKKDFQL